MRFIILWLGSWHFESINFKFTVTDGLLFTTLLIYALVLDGRESGLLK